MKRPESALEPEFEALLNPRSIERVAPPHVRARALARGRAIVAGGGRIPARFSLELLSRPSAKPVPARASARFLLPASFAVAAVAMAAASAAVRRSPPRTPNPPASARLSLPASSPVDDASVRPSPVVASVVAPVLTPHRQAPNASAPSTARFEREVGPSELELLARAQAAYSHRDFARAIAQIGELSRRFPNGHLAEEREALRVRCLFGLGNPEEGRRAGAAFAAKFPRSVLLPKDGKP